MNTRDKQIEEMSKELLDEFGTMILAEADCIAVSSYLKSKGYRKSNEVAEELLEMAECYGAGVLFWRKVKQFAIELKKNCTEEPNANNNH